MERIETKPGTCLQAPDPTPAEIKRLCGEIRAAWSPAERRRRAGGFEEARHVETPVIATDSTWQNAS